MLAALLIKSSKYNARFLEPKDYQDYGILRSNYSLGSGHPILIHYWAKSSALNNVSYLQDSSNILIKINKSQYKRNINDGAERVY